jgi:hypothetical protein
MRQPVLKEVLGMKLLPQIGLYAAVALVAAALVPVALGSSAGGKKSGASLSLVVLDSSGNAASTAPHWGDQVTFDVSTDVAYPSVELDCFQNGVWVYEQIVGFYPTFVDQTFTLKSFYWTGGAADCTATLYTTNKNGSRTTLSTLSFAVAA